MPRRSSRSQTAAGCARRSWSPAKARDLGKQPIAPSSYSPALAESRVALCAIGHASSKRPSMASSPAASEQEPVCRISRESGQAARSAASAGRDQGTSEIRRRSNAALSPGRAEPWRSACS